MMIFFYFLVLIIKFKNFELDKKFSFIVEIVTFVWDFILDDFLDLKGKFDGYVVSIRILGYCV